jgi:DNA-3-methyladenine glycosylase I
MSWYCDVAPGHAVHGPYHDKEYGFPLEDERALFERLCLEIFQAGLSWEIVLKKRPALLKAFHRFQVTRVAAYAAADEKRLLADAGIIRNRLKIKAIIENARRIKDMRKTHEGFAGFLATHHPMKKAEWVKLFKKHFVFTGGEIVNEFLMSVGYLPFAHRDSCAVFKRIKKEYALPWLTAQKKGFVYE